jgi:hypothetical protein
VDLVAVLAGISGAVLIWASLKNKHPIKAVQLALSGGDPNAAPPFTAATDVAAAPPAASGPGPLDQYDPNAPGLGGMPTI